MSDVRAHIIVEGLVQGVGFRWFVAKAAESMGIRGFTRNLYDGSVEVEAEADRSLVEELIGKIKVGPRSAQVTNLKIEWLEPVGDPGKGFAIR
jgi:acylphosphatase